MVGGGGPLPPKAGPSSPIGFVQSILFISRIYFRFTRSTRAQALTKMNSKGHKEGAEEDEDEEGTPTAPHEWAAEDGELWDEEGAAYEPAGGGSRVDAEVAPAAAE